MDGGFFERRSTSREPFREMELFLDSKPDDLNGIMAYVLLKAHKITGSMSTSKRRMRQSGILRRGSHQAI